MESRGFWEYLLGYKTLRTTVGRDPDHRHVGWLHGRPSGKRKNIDSGAK